MSAAHEGKGNARYSWLEELPYVMGQIRQAFEKQMGNAEVEA